MYVVRALGSCRLFVSERPHVVCVSREATPFSIDNMFCTNSLHVINAPNDAIYALRC